MKGKWCSAGGQSLQNFGAPGKRCKRIRCPECNRLLTPSLGARGGSARLTIPQHKVRAHKKKQGRKQTR